MNIRSITSTVAGVTLFALALPTAALAKGAALPDQTAHMPGVTVVAQDSGPDKPQVEGWSTNPDDFSDEDCQGFADQIETSIGDALDNLDSNDLEGVFANLDSADGMEDLANEMGCAINYIEKAAPGGGKGASSPEPKEPIATAKVEGWQTGDGGASDAKCQGYADTIQEALDDGAEQLENGDVEGALNNLDLADAVEDAALNQGCAISYPV